MTQTHIPGSIRSHTYIGPEKIRKYGPTASINQALLDVRNQLQQLVPDNHPGQGRPTVHIVVTVEPHTDAAGSPLMTREGAGDAPGAGRARG